MPVGKGNFYIPYSVFTKNNYMNLQLHFAAALLLGTAFAANGQSPVFEAGVQAGPGLAWMSGNEFANNYRSNMATPAAGIFLQGTVGRRMALRIHLQYEVKGAGSSGETVDATGGLPGVSRYRNAGRYLTLPLLLRVYTGRQHRFFVNAGPYAAFLLNWAERFKIAGQQPVTINVTSRFEGFDAGICAGAGFSWPIGRLTSLTAEGRYSRGLVNISSLPVAGQGRLQTQVFHCLFGVSRKLVKQRK